jgi:hypothetical protein
MALLAGGAQCQRKSRECGLFFYREDRRHRVGRVLSVSPVVGIGTPPPL